MAVKDPDDAPKQNHQKICASIMPENLRRPPIKEHQKPGQSPQNSHAGEDAGEGAVRGGRPDPDPEKRTEAKERQRGKTTDQAYPARLELNIPNPFYISKENTPIIKDRFHSLSEVAAIQDPASVDNVKNGKREKAPQKNLEYLLPTDIFPVAAYEKDREESQSKNHGGEGHAENHEEKGLNDPAK